MNEIGKLIENLKELKFSIIIPVISQGINETDEDYKQRILKTMKIKEVRGRIDEYNSKCSR